MKVIFLDMDGVLNSNAFFRRPEQVFGTIEYSRENEFFGSMIDPEAVKVLSEIAEKSGAHLVLSSSWRMVLTTDDLIGLLRKAGYNGDGFLGRTDSAGATRAEEIARYGLSVGDMTHFLVLDDSSDAIIPNHTITTSYGHGLTAEHIPEALRILGVKP